MALFHGGSHPMQDAVLVTVVLIITLTYQAMANPPSTFLKEGSTRVDWSCLNNLSHLKTPINDCPALLALLFMIFNTGIFIASIAIVLVILRMSRPATSLVLLVRTLTLCLVFCYAFLLTAFCYNAVYVAFPFALIALGLFLFTGLDEDHPESLVLSSVKGVANIIRDY